MMLISFYTYLIKDPTFKAVFLYSRSSFLVFNSFLNIFVNIIKLKKITRVCKTIYIIKHKLKHNYVVRSIFKWVIFLQHAQYFHKNPYSFSRNNSGSKY